MSSTDAVPDRPLTVMAYNILQGVGMDNVESLERIASAIRDAGADIVALEEVAVEESGDQADRIAELAGLAACVGSVALSDQSGCARTTCQWLDAAGVSCSKWN